MLSLHTLLKVIDTLRKGSIGPSCHMKLYSPFLQEHSYFY